MNEPPARDAVDPVRVSAANDAAAQAVHARILNSLSVDLARVEQLASWQDWTRDQGEGRIVRHAEKVPRNLIHVRMRAGVPGRDPHVSLPQGTGE